MSDAPKADTLRTAGRFGVVYRADLQAAAALGPNCAAVWAALATWANGDDGETVWPSQETVAELLGVSVPTVRRAIALLRKAGMIHRKYRTAQGRRVGNEYTLLGVVHYRSPVIASPPSSDAPSDHRCAVDERAPARALRGTTEEEQQDPADLKVVAEEVARNFYDFVKRETGGATPTFMALRAAVLKAMKDHHLTRAQLGAALLELWRERRVMQPSAAMLAERVARARVGQPATPTRDRDKPFYLQPGWNADNAEEQTG